MLSHAMLVEGKMNRQEEKQLDEKYGKLIEMSIKKCFGFQWKSIQKVCKKLAPELFHDYHVYCIVNGKRMQDL